MGLLDTIDAREAEVLRMRFGLNGTEPLTLQEVGIKVGLTRERVRQIEVETLERLGRQLGSNQSLALLFRTDAEENDENSSSSTSKQAETSSSLTELLSSKHQSKYSKNPRPKQSGN